MLKAFIAGILHGLGYAPFNNVFASILSLILFYHVISRCKTRKEAIINTLIFGCSYYIFSLHWIVNSLLIDIKRWWFVIPFEITLIPLCFSLYYLLITIPFFYIKKKKYSFIFFSLLWILAEYLKSVLFTGFPWNLLGSIWLDYDLGIFLLQKTGVYFVGFITIFSSLLLYKLLANKEYYSSLCLVSTAILAFYLYKNNDQTNQIDQSTKIRLIQPNIKQQFTWSYAELEKIFYKLIDITFVQNDSKDFDIIIWPETAFPFIIDTEYVENNHFLQYLSNFLRDGQFLITGAIRTQDDKSYNSLVVLDNKGEIVDFYDKKHLVPFGEYIPFKKWIKIDSITNLGSLDSGDENKSYLEIDNNNKDTKIFPLICYEGIFPFKINEKIDFVVNLTNDAWFGNSFGPHQHLRAVRLQAVQANQFVFRVANNGITAIIDNRGHVLKKIDLNQEGILDF